MRPEAVDRASKRLRPTVNAALGQLDDASGNKLRAGSVRSASQSAAHAHDTARGAEDEDNWFREANHGMSLLRPTPGAIGLFMGGEQGEILSRRLVLDRRFRQFIQS